MEWNTGCYEWACKDCLPVDIEIDGKGETKYLKSKKERVYIIYYTGSL